MALNFTQALMEAKRRAQLLGRPLSQQEASGIAEGYAEQASDRLAKAKALAIQEGNLDLQRAGLSQNESQFQRNLDLQKKQLEDEKKAAAMQTVGNLGTTAATLYAMKGMSAPAAAGGTATGATGTTVAGAGTGGATATGASATGAGATGASGVGGYLTNVPAIGAIIAASLGIKNAAQKERHDEVSLMKPKDYFAESASHPVAAVTSPGAILADTGIVKKDTALGEVATFTSELEEKFMKPLSNSVVCTELYRQGLMDEETYLKDAEFGQKQDLETMVGYHVWGIPLATAMRESKLITWLIKPLALAWAENMAGQDNLLGAFLNKIGVPLCRMIGRFKLIVAEVQ